MMARWQADLEIQKLDRDQHIAYGWMSVATSADGTPIIDLQGDIIEPDELEKAATAWMLDSRDVGAMHAITKGIGQPVASLVLTSDIQKALGIPPGLVPVGWFVGLHVDDPATWAKIKSGEYAAFSIGGSAHRVEET